MVVSVDCQRANLLARRTIELNRRRVDDGCGIIADVVLSAAEANATADCRSPGRTETPRIILWCTGLPRTPPKIAVDSVELSCGVLLIVAVELYLR